MFSLEKSAGRNKTKIVVVNWTTGLSVLPEPGGMLDQKMRLMIFFDQFIEGERVAAQKRIDKAS